MRARCAHDTDQDSKVQSITLRIIIKGVILARMRYIAARVSTARRRLRPPIPMFARPSVQNYGSYPSPNGLLFRGIHLHRPIPRKYRPINGTIIKIIETGSGGVKMIAASAMLSTETRQ